MGYIKKDKLSLYLNFKVYYFEKYYFKNGMIDASRIITEALLKVVEDNKYAASLQNANFKRCLLFEIEIN